MMQRKKKFSFCTLLHNVISGKKMSEIKLLRSIAARLTVIENRLDQQQPVLHRRCQMVR
jgi:hypothetical protein